MNDTDFLLSQPIPSSQTITAPIKRTKNLVQPRLLQPPADMMDWQKQKSVSGDDTPGPSLLNITNMGSNEQEPINVSVPDKKADILSKPISNLEHILYALAIGPRPYFTMLAQKRMGEEESDKQMMRQEQLDKKRMLRSREARLEELKYESDMKKEQPPLTPSQQVDDARQRINQYSFLEKDIMGRVIGRKALPGQESEYQEALSDYRALSKKYRGNIAPPTMLKPVPLPKSDSATPIQIQQSGMSQAESNIREQLSKDPTNTPDVIDEVIATMKSQGRLK